MINDDRMEERMDHIAQRTLTYGVLPTFTLRLSNLSCFIPRTTEYSAHRLPNNCHTFGLWEGSMRLMNVINLGPEPRASSLRIRIPVYPWCRPVTVWEEDGVPRGV